MQNQPRLVLSSGLSALELGERLRNASDDAGLRKREQTFYLLEMEERCLYLESGHSSTRHFAESQLDMDWRRTREYLQLGKTLNNLELLDEALCNCELSWTKVLAVLPVIQRETQVSWVECAKGCSSRELKDIVARCRPGQTPEEANEYGMIRRMTALHTKLPDEVHAKLDQIRELMGEVSDAKMIAALVDTWLEKYGKPTETKIDNSPRDVEEKGEPIDPELREQILRRDEHRCCNCHAHSNLDVHHIHFRRHGGSNDPGNLITLCKTCHDSMHRDFLQLHGNPESTGVYFTNRNGIPVNRGERPPASLPAATQ